MIARAPTSLSLLRVAEKRVFQAQRAFFAHPSPKALVEPCFASAALGCCCNGHDTLRLTCRDSSAGRCPQSAPLSGRQDQALWHSLLVYLDSCPFLPLLTWAHWFELVPHVVGSWRVCALPGNYGTEEWQVVASLLGIQTAAVDGFMYFLHK